MNRVTTWGRICTALLVGGIFAVAACDDDPAQVDDHIEEAAGILIRAAAGDTLFMHLDADPFPPAPHFTLSQGTDTEVDMFFVDEHGDIIDTQGGAEEFGLEVTTGDDAILMWTPSSPDGFAGTLAAGAVGSTTITLDLLHEGHSDYTSPDFTVDVQ